MSNLTPKQKAFVEHYLNTLNATKAAELAGYRGTYPSLSVIGHENLRKVKIKKQIERRMAESAMSADEALHMLRGHAQATIEDFVEFNADGSFWVDLSKAKEAGVLHLAREVKQEKRVTKDADGNTQTTYKTFVKLHDAQKAIETILKVHGKLNPKQQVEMSGEVSVKYVNDWRENG